MGDPCDEIPRNHSKGSRKRFYTLWADFCLWWPAENDPLLPVVTGSNGPISLIRCVGSRGSTSLR